MKQIETQGQGIEKVCEILLLGPASTFKWLPIKRDDLLPPNAVHTGATRRDGELYVAKKGEFCGKMNLAKGRMWNIWTHKSGGSDSGEVLVVDHHPNPSVAD